MEYDSFFVSWFYDQLLSGADVSDKAVLKEILLSGIEAINEQGFSFVKNKANLVRLQNLIMQADTMDRFIKENIKDLISFTPEQVISAASDANNEMDLSATIGIVPDLLTRYQALFVASIPVPQEESTEMEEQAEAAEEEQSDEEDFDEGEDVPDELAIPPIIVSDLTLIDAVTTMHKIKDYIIESRLLSEEENQELIQLLQDTFKLATRLKENLSTAIKFIASTNPLRESYQIYIDWLTTVLEVLASEGASEEEERGSKPSRVQETVAKILLWLEDQRQKRADETQKSQSFMDLAEELNKCKLKLKSETQEQIVTAIIQGTITIFSDVLEKTEDPFVAEAYKFGKEQLEQALALVSSKGVKDAKAKITSAIRRAENKAQTFWKRKTTQGERPAFKPYCEEITDEVDDLGERKWRRVDLDEYDCVSRGKRWVTRSLTKGKKIIESVLLEAIKEIQNMQIELASGHKSNQINLLYDNLSILYFVASILFDPTVIVRTPAYSTIFEQCPLLFRVSFLQLSPCERLTWMLGLDFKYIYDIAKNFVPAEDNEFDTYLSTNQIEQPDLTQQVQQLASFSLARTKAIHSNQLSDLAVKVITHAQFCFTSVPTQYDFITSFMNANPDANTKEVNEIGDSVKLLTDKCSTVEQMITITKIMLYDIEDMDQAYVDFLQDFVIANYQAFVQDSSSRPIFKVITDFVKYRTNFTSDHEEIRSLISDMSNCEDPRTTLYRQEDALTQCNSKLPIPESPSDEDKNNIILLRRELEISAEPSSISYKLTKPWETLQNASFDQMVYILQNLKDVYAQVRPEIKDKSVLDPLVEMVLDKKSIDVISFVRTSKDKAKLTHLKSTWSKETNRTRIQNIIKQLRSAGIDLSKNTKEVVRKIKDYVNALSEDEDIKEFIKDFIHYYGTLDNLPKSVGVKIGWGGKANIKGVLGLLAFNKITQLPSNLIDEAYEEAKKMFKMKQFDNTSDRDLMLVNLIRFYHDMNTLGQYDDLITMYVEELVRFSTLWEDKSDESSKELRQELAERCKQRAAKGAAYAKILSDRDVKAIVKQLDKVVSKTEIKQDAFVSNLTLRKIRNARFAKDQSVKKTYQVGMDYELQKQINLHYLHPVIFSKLIRRIREDKDDVVMAFNTRGGATTWQWFVSDVNNKTKDQTANPNFFGAKIKLKRVNPLFVGSSMNLYYPTIDFWKDHFTHHSPSCDSQAMIKKYTSLGGKDQKFIIGLFNETGDVYVINETDLQQDCERSDKYSIRSTEKIAFTKISDLTYTDKEQLKNTLKHLEFGSNLPANVSSSFPELVDLVSTIGDLARRCAMLSFVFDSKSPLGDQAKAVNRMRNKGSKLFLHFQTLQQFVPEILALPAAMQDVIQAVFNDYVQKVSSIFLTKFAKSLDFMGIRNTINEQSIGLYFSSLGNKVMYAMKQRDGTLSLCDESKDEITHPIYYIDDQNKVRCLSLKDVNDIFSGTRTDVPLFVRESIRKDFGNLEMGDAIKEVLKTKSRTSKYISDLSERKAFINELSKTYNVSVDKVETLLMTYLEAEQSMEIKQAILSYLKLVPEFASLVMNDDGLSRGDLVTWQPKQGKIKKSLKQYIIETTGFSDAYDAKNKLVLTTAKILACLDSVISKPDLSRDFTPIIVSDIANITKPEGFYEIKPTGGSGSGMRVSVNIRTDTSEGPLVSIMITNNGSNYKQGDNLTIDKSELGNYKADIVFKLEPIVNVNARSLRLPESKTVFVCDKCSKTSIEPIETRFMKDERVMLRRYCSLACSASDARRFTDPDTKVEDKQTSILSLFQRILSFPVTNLSESLFGDWNVYLDLISKTKFDFLEKPINPVAANLQPTMYVTMYELWVIYALLFAPIIPEILIGAGGDRSKQDVLINDIKAKYISEFDIPEDRRDVTIPVEEMYKQLYNEYPDVYFEAVMSLGIPTHVDNAFYRSSQSNKRLRYITNHIALLRPDLASISIKVGKSMNNPNLSGDQAKQVLAISSKLKALAETKKLDKVESPEITDIEALALSTLPVSETSAASRNTIAPFCDLTIKELKSWLYSKLLQNGNWRWNQKQPFKFGDEILWPFYKEFKDCSKNMINLSEEKWIKMLPKIKQYILDWMQSKSTMYLSYEQMEYKAFMEGGDMQVLRMKQFNPPEKQYEITVTELYKQYRQRHLAQARAEEPSKASEIHEERADVLMKSNNPNTDAIELGTYINSLYPPGQKPIAGATPEEVGMNFQLMIWSALPAPEKEGAKMMGKEKGPVYSITVVLDFPYELLNIPTSEGTTAPFRYGGKLGHGKVEEIDKSKMSKFIGFSSKISKALANPEIEARYFQTLQIVDTMLSCIEQILQESNTSLDLSLIAQVEETVSRGRSRIAVGGDEAIDAELSMRRALDEGISNRNKFRKQIEKEYNEIFDRKGKISAFTSRGETPTLTAYDSQRLFYYPEKPSYEQEGLYSITSTESVEEPELTEQEEGISFDEVQAAMEEIEAERSAEDLGTVTAAELAEDESRVGYSEDVESYDDYQVDEGESLDDQDYDDEGI